MSTYELTQKDVYFLPLHVPMNIWDMSAEPEGEDGEELVVNVMFKEELVAQAYKDSGRWIFDIMPRISPSAERKLARFIEARKLQAIADEN